MLSKEFEKSLGDHSLREQGEPDAMIEERLHNLIGDLQDVGVGLETV